MSIRILDEKTYNQISAGEVIERPRSIIRELIDNGIDAKAQQIDILLTFAEDDMEIEVRDNGVGIEKIDMPLSIRRHATSKITSFEDIFDLSTFGFRGEALSSIASVSFMTIISSVKEDGSAAKMISKGMEIEGIVGSVRDRGTTVKVKNIFYNTPVRKKFLRSHTAEKTQIKKEVILKILGNDGVGFSYSIQKDGRTKEELKIEKQFTLKEKIYYLFGKKLHDELIIVDGFYGEGEDRVWVDGYITGAQYRGKHRRDQYFFLFNRPIENATLSKAINSVYTNVLPTRTHCACFLRVSLAKDRVDVNVHPTKKDVKFDQSDIVYRAVYHLAKEALYQQTYHRQEKVMNPSYQASFQTKLKKEMGEEKIFQGDFQSKDFLSEDNSNDRRDFSYGSTSENIVDISKEEYSIIDSDEEKQRAIPKQGQISELKEDSQEKNNLLPSILILGQLAQTYIIFSINGGLYVMDQHAAHERLNFDRVKEKIDQQEDAQYLLVPIILKFSPSKRDEVVDLLPILKKIGINLEVFGEDGFQLQTIPSYMPKDKTQSIVEKIVEDILENPQLKISDILEKMISTIACRMSIMAGKDLSEKEMFDIVYELYQKNYIHHCPHGRPFIKSFEAKEVENFFERH